MKKITYLLTILLFAASIIGCASTKKDIPENLSAAQLIQLGQNEYSSGHYKASEQYYLTVIKRYGMDTAVYIETKYELGHLYVATRDYKKAYDAFSEILEIYEYASYGELPASYKKLAQIGMSKIPEAKRKELQAASEKSETSAESEE